MNFVKILKILSYYIVRHRQTINSTSLFAAWAAKQNWLLIFRRWITNCIEQEWTSLLEPAQLLRRYSKHIVYSWWMNEELVKCSQHKVLWLSWWLHFNLIYRDYFLNKLEHSKEKRNLSICIRQQYNCERWNCT